MLKKTPILAVAVAAALGLVSVANATITVTAVRSTNQDIAGYDDVWLFALNDGTGVDAGNTNIVSVNGTITDKTQAGLLPGVYVSPSDGSSYQGDPDGAQMRLNSSAGDFSDPVPGYNSTTYPSPANNTPAAFSLYSWIGNGRFNSANYALAQANPDPNVISSSMAGTGYGTLLTSYSVQAGWTSGGISASAASGGVGGKSATVQNNFAAAGLNFLGDGALIGLAVVKTGDVVEFTGAVGGAQPGTASQTFDVINGAVPEPASLGMLALGGLALLARRRKTA